MNREQLTQELIAKREEIHTLSDNLKEVNTSRFSLMTTIGVLLTLLGLSVWYVVKQNNSSVQQELTAKLSKTKQQLEEARNNLSFVSITREDFMKDLQANYPEVSTRAKKQILQTIMDESANYDINPLILYSVLYVESSFHPWIEHTPVNITINKKSTRVRAVGLGGVVWEWWGSKLKAAGIAETRGDLFDLETNIKATAFVYNEMYKMKIHKSAKNKDESALLRYFGGDYPVYLQRIDSKISKFVRPNLYRKD